MKKIKMLKTLAYGCFALSVASNAFASGDAPSSDTSSGTLAGVQTMSNNSPNASGIFTPAGENSSVSSAGNFKAAPSMDVEPTGSKSKSERAGEKLSKAERKEKQIQGLEEKFRETQDQAEKERDKAKKERYEAKKERIARQIKLLKMNKEDRRLDTAFAPFGKYLEQEDRRKQKNEAYTKILKGKYADADNRAKALAEENDRLKAEGNSRSVDSDELDKLKNYTAHLETVISDLQSQLQQAMANIDASPLRTNAPAPSLEREPSESFGEFGPAEPRFGIPSRLSASSTNSSFAAQRSESDYLSIQSKAEPVGKSLMNASFSFVGGQETPGIEMSGFRGAEGWGNWSIAPNATVKVTGKFPSKFTLKLNARTPFGGSVTIGNVTKALPTNADWSVHQHDIAFDLGDQQTSEIKFNANSDNPEGLRIGLADFQVLPAQD